MRFLVALVVMLIPTISYAQAQVTFDMPNVTSAMQAQGFIYKLYVTPAGSSTTNSPVTLVNTLCGGNPPIVQCSTALPQTANAALVTGAKSELTATDSSSGVESPKSAPFFRATSAPTNLRIIP